MQPRRRTHRFLPGTVLLLGNEEQALKDTIACRTLSEDEFRTSLKCS